MVWEHWSTNDTRDTGSPANVVGALFTRDTTTFAGTSGGVFPSTNNGTNWTPVLGMELYEERTTSFIAKDQNLYAGSVTAGVGNVSLSTNNGAEWSRISPPLQVLALVVKDASIFAAGYIPSDAMNVDAFVGVFVSTNNGTSWSDVNEGIPPVDNVVRALAAKDANIYAAVVPFPSSIYATSGGVYMSSNNGSSWTSSGLTNTPATCFAVSGNNLFAGTDGNGVFVSTNDGASWTSVNSGLANASVNRGPCG